MNNDTQSTPPPTTTARLTRCEILMNKQSDTAMYSLSEWTDLALELESQLSAAQGEAERLRRLLARIGETVSSSHDFSADHVLAFVEEANVKGVMEDMREIPKDWIINKAGSEQKPSSPTGANRGGA